MTEPLPPDGRLSDLQGLDAAALFRELPGSFVLLDPTTGRVVALSRDLEEAIGPDAAADPTQYLSGFVTSEVRGALESAPASSEPTRVPRVRVVFRGVEIHVDVTVRPIRSGDQTTLLVVRLDDATDLVVSETEASSARAEAVDVRERQRQLFELVHLGVVYQDATGAIVEANPAAVDVLGATSLDGLRGLDSDSPRWQAIDTDGRPLPGERHAAMVALRTGEPNSGTIMGIARLDGSQRRWLRVAASPHRDEHGDVVGVYAIFEDVTEAWETERALAEQSVVLDSVLETTPVAFAVVDADGILRRVNRAFTAVLDDVGVTGSAAVDRSLDEILGTLPALAGQLLPLVRRSLDARRAVRGIEVTHDGRVADHPRVWLVDCFPLRVDGATRGAGLALVEISERRRLERISAELERERADSRLRRALTAVHDPILVAAPVEVDGVVADFVIEQVAGAIDGPIAVALDAAAGRRFTEAWPAVVSSGLLDLFVRAFTERTHLRTDAFEFAPADGAGPMLVDINAAEADGQLYVVWRDVTERMEQERQLREAERIARLARWYQAEDGRIHLSSAAPVVTGHASMAGALAAFEPTVRRLVVQVAESFGPIEIQLRDGTGERRDLVVVGERTGASGWRGTLQDVSRLRAVERALAHEHEVAELLQRVMVPEELAPIDGVDLAARYESASGPTRVGGDWFDVVQLDEPSRFAMFVGDVAGHGLAATEAMVQLRQWSRLLALDDPSPSSILRALNAIARRFLPGEMATASVAIVDLADSSVCWATAGHPPPVTVRDGVGTLLDHGAIGPPIGVTEDWTGGDRSDPLSGVTSIVMYTDGLVERRGEHPDVGLDRLVATLSSATSDAAGLCDRLMDALRSGAERRDDACVLIAGFPSASA